MSRITKRQHSLSDNESEEDVVSQLLTGDIAVKRVRHEYRPGSRTPESRIRQDQDQRGDYTPTMDTREDSIGMYRCWYLAN